MRFLFLTSVAIGCLCLSLISAETWSEPISTEILYGRTARYCEYKGMKFRPYSKFTDYETCATCTCTRDGLSCFGRVEYCTYSDNSPCVDVTIGCRKRWVLRYKKTRKCPHRLFESMEKDCTG